jgi:hypothetical protein
MHSLDYVPRPAAPAFTIHSNHSLQVKGKPNLTTAHVLHFVNNRAKFDWVDGTEPLCTVLEEEEELHKQTQEKKPEINKYMSRAWAFFECLSRPRQETSDIHHIQGTSEGTCSKVGRFFFVLSFLVFLEALALSLLGFDGDWQSQKSIRMCNKANGKST